MQSINRTTKARCSPLLLFNSFKSATGLYPPDFSSSMNPVFQLQKGSAVSSSSESYLV